MKVVLTHPTGNRNVRAVIAALAKYGMLSRFNTTVAANPKASWSKLLPKGVRQEWLRRTYPVPSALLQTYPVLEFSRMVLPKIGLKSSVRPEHGWASVDAVYKDLDRKTAGTLERQARKHGVTAVYAYEDGALATFKRAKELGLKCIYDLPIAFWQTARRLMKEEAERLPDWAATLGGGVTDSAVKLERKTKELQLADVVISPGQFVTGSLPAWTIDKKIITSPFGSPEAAGQSDAHSVTSEKHYNRPLRVLFVGSMGQRKGLGDLFEAVRILNTKEIELVVMGSLLAPIEFYTSKLPNFTYEHGRSNEEVLALMRTCDVFCLPSIVEGRALVMQEAMSQGLPIIITENTGGSDLVKAGETGFLVPIRTPAAIAEKLAWFLEHRANVSQMGRLAREHAATYTWESYGNRIIEGISNLNGN